MQNEDECSAFISPKQKLGGEKNISTIMFIYLFNRIQKHSVALQCFLCNLLHTPPLLLLALNAGSEELKRGCFFFFSPWGTFFGGLWHNWSGRVKVWEQKWSFFMNSGSFRWHAGRRCAAPLPERNTKSPLTRASWRGKADAFLLRSDERNPPCCQAAHLKWTLLQGKKGHAWLSDGD